MAARWGAVVAAPVYSLGHVTLDQLFKGADQLIVRINVKFKDLMLFLKYPAWN